MLYPSPSLFPGPNVFPGVPVGWQVKEDAPPADWSACLGPPPMFQGTDVREFQGEFETEMYQVEGASTERRPDAVSLDYQSARSVGPEALGDPSLGLLRRVWEVKVDGAALWIRRSTYTIAQWYEGLREWDVWEPLFAFSGAPLDEIDLAFEQNGRAVIAAERAGRVWLYWYDPRVADFVFANLCQGRSPRLLLDDPLDVEDSDALLFYVSDEHDRLEMRQQREWYEVVHATPITGASNLFCEEVARATDNRLHVIYSRRNVAAGTYQLHTLESAPYPYRDRAAFRPAALLSSGQVLTTTIEPLTEPTALRPAAALAEAALVLLVEEHTQPAEDALRPAASAQLADVVTFIVEHEQPAEDAIQPTALAQSGNVVTVIIEHSQPTEDALRPSAVLLSATLVTL